MANVLDFNKQKKEYLTVKLHDEKKTVLMIGTPTRSILRNFIDINESIEASGGVDADMIDDLYNVCAKIMSFNKGGIKITGDYLSDFFDLEDITTFFNAYMDYIGSVTNAKN